VIVAEDITSRFLNVIHLFNGAIPLIALKMTAYKVGDDYALTFVKVLDELVYGLIDDDEGTTVPTTRKKWEDYSPQSLSLADNLFEIVQEIVPGAVMNYTKHYIGVAVDGVASNFVVFNPTKKHVIVEIRLDQNEEYDSQFTDAGFDMLKYNSHFNYYRVRIASSPDETLRDSLKNLIQEARDKYLS
jgi:hypothetical protein